MQSQRLNMKDLGISGNYASNFHHSVAGSQAAAEKQFEGGQLPNP